MTGIIISKTEQNRIEELTEWCRNKPEKAALRIIEAEMGVSESQGPWQAPEFPRFRIISEAREPSGCKSYLCEAKSRGEAQSMFEMCCSGQKVVINGHLCKILNGDVYGRTFEVVEE